MNPFKNDIQLCIEKHRRKLLVCSAFLTAVASCYSLYVSYLIVNWIVKGIAEYTTEFTESDITMFSLFFFFLLFIMMFCSGMAFYLTLRSIKNFRKRKEIS